MAAYISPCFTPSDSRLLTVLRKNVSPENHLGRVHSFRVIESKKSRVLAAAQKSESSPIRNSPRHFQTQDPFLNLHPEISMLRGEGTNTIANPRKETSTGPITEDFDEPSVPSTYNEARIKVIGVGGGGSNAVYL